MSDSLFIIDCITLPSDKAEIISSQVEVSIDGLETYSVFIVNELKAFLTIVRSNVPMYDSLTLSLVNCQWSAICSQVKNYRLLSDGSAHSQSENWKVGNCSRNDIFLNSAFGQSCSLTLHNKNFLCLPVLSFFLFYACLRDHYHLLVSPGTIRLELFGLTLR